MRQAGRSTVRTPTSRCLRRGADAQLRGVGRSRFGAGRRGRDLDRRQRRGEDDAEEDGGPGALESGLNDLRRAT